MMNQAEKQAVRKLAFRYASMLQQQMYEVISAQLLGAVERGEMVQVDCDAARRVAHAAAKAVIDAADPVVLAHA